MGILGITIMCYCIGAAGIIGSAIILYCAWRDRNARRRKSIKSKHSEIT